MQELVYFKNYCPRCGGGIEFPAHGAGRSIPCPHCKTPIPLTFPKNENIDPTRQIDAYLELGAFPKTRPQVAFLKVIAFPAQAGEVRDLDAWTRLLRGSPADLVARFVKAGMLQPTDGDTAPLLKTRTKDELKQLAKKRHLSQTGTKEDLLHRLFAADPAGMTALFQANPYLTCTPQGRSVVEKFTESESDLRVKAETSALAALRAGDFEEACKAVAAFEASKVFQRGKGIDWNKYDATHDLDILRAVAAAHPKALRGIPPEALPSLRVSACMMGLWGDNNPKKWLTDDERQYAHGAFMLLHAAIAKIRLKDMKRAGATEVKVSSTSPANLCPVCANDDGKIYSVDSAPELPHAGCTCEYGCACLLNPAG
jgi:hypothetical protein